MTMHSETSTIYDVAKTKLITDAQLDQAKITLFRFAGVGVLAALLGAGVGLACFGYSYVNDGRNQAQKIGDAIVQALKTTKLNVTGDIKMADGSAVALAPGGQVGIAPDSIVRVALPSIGIGNANGRSTTIAPPVEVAPLPETKVVTQYTIFKTVSLGKGHVVTGWNFDNSNQVNPAKQYCYYDELAADNTHVRTDLGQNGTMMNNLPPRAGVDLTAAFNNCVWFSGSL